MNKPFISKNNPFNESECNGEIFSIKYIYPKYWLTWILLFFSLFLAYLPRYLRLLLGDLLGWYLYKTNQTKKNVVDKNLDLTFTKMSITQKSKISKSFFRYLGHMYINMPLLWWKNNESLQKYIQKDGMKYIDESLSMGKSVIILAPHSISLDFAGRALAKYNLLSMYKPFKNDLINWFIGKSRSKSTDKVIVYPRSKTSMKNIIKKMKKPCVLYLLADEDISREDSMFCDFFDDKKNTLKSVSRLARITNSTVFPCVCLYDIKQSKYAFKLLPEI